MKDDVTNKEPNKIELHNREMSDILGDPPVWIVRIGGPIFYSIIIILLLGTFWFQYPDKANGYITIGDQENIEWIIAQSSGLIENFFVADNKAVVANDTIGLIKNPSSFKDMGILKNSLSLLEKYLETNDVSYLANFPNNLIVGDMEDGYENLLSSIENCLIYEKLSTYNKKRKLIQQELQILQADSESNKLQIVQTKQKLIDLQIEYELRKETNRKNINLAYERLINEIEIWKNKYIIQNKMEGKIIMGAPWVIGQMIHIGDTICSVISPVKKNPVGRMVLSYKEISGLQKGNQVKINIDEYPARIYGSIIGKVDSIMYVPAKRNYAIEVELPYPLKSSNGKIIDYNVELHGKAEIITQNKSVFERIFNPLIENIY